MSYKKNNVIGKLHYDFSTNLACYVLNKDKWVHSTERMFRSFNGKRKLAGMMDGEYLEIEYDGPIYYYNTNELVSKSKLEPGINWGSNTPQQTTSRRNELKYLS